MAYDASFFGGGREGRWCKACRQPIAKGQPIAHVHIASEPDLSGVFHERCSQPYRVLERLMNGTIFGAR